jgi:phosphoribosylaminoimidazolecarboxamide formyltransferase/IMP cyclohydrolase
MGRGTDISQRKASYRNRTEGDFPDRLEIVLDKEWDLKYGENPGQHGAIYTFNTVGDVDASTIPRLTNLQSVRSDGKGKGGLSMTNVGDITRAMDTAKFFLGSSTVVIMKHNLVSGFATDYAGTRDRVDLFRAARDADRLSNFGGTALFTDVLDMDTALALYELYNPGRPGHWFPDVIAAPGFDRGVVDYIEKKAAGVRIGEFSGLDKLPKFVGDETYGLVSIKEMPSGRLGVQDVYLTGLKSVDDLITDPMVKGHVVARDPTPQEARDCLTAWYLNIAGARSNGIVVVKDGVSKAMGSGQVARIESVAFGLIKGIQKEMDREGISYDRLEGIIGYEKLEVNPYEGASLSSDAFYPFDDCLEVMASVGVSATIQPYGSIADAKVIDTANRLKMAMPAADNRCFGHF